MRARATMPTAIPTLAPVLMDELEGFVEPDPADEPVSPAGAAESEDEDAVVPEALLVSVVLDTGDLVLVAPGESVVDVAGIVN
jgi:hypothetical protein